MLEIISRYKIPILLGGASVLAIALSVVLLFKSFPPASPIEFSSEQATESATIRIDIEGAVKVPGLYELAGDSRVEDAITAAGGLSGEADTALIAKTINRAQKLVDGGKLYIPTLSSSSPAVAGSHTGLISVNSASESELDTLPGVGPVTAQKIIAGRPYNTIEELVTKKAVGQSTFEKIKALISL